ncbi:MAG: cyclic nucleotide-binding domain-containing protein [Acaryochloris sp. CRU_2_0]|nr:cyclic nucleotide-binding domain-containing protein [Acaryochloris sp. CRU_2_0]
MPTLSIRQTVPLMILVPLLAYGGLTGWLAVANGHRTVDELSSLNSRTLNAQIKERLKDHLETPMLLQRFNAEAMSLGQVNLQNLEGLRRQFLTEMRLLKEIDGIELGFAETGSVQGVERLEGQSLVIAISDASTGFAKIRYATDPSGKLGKVVRVSPNYDARQRPWYRQAIRANRLTWTKPFSKFSDKKLLQICLVQPIYAQNSQKIVGVLSVQFLQANISKFLQTLKVGKSGKIFIVNRAGELVATSTVELLFKEKGAEVKLIPAIQSQDSLIRATAQHLQTQYPGFKQMPDEMLLKFPVQGDLHLAQITRYQNKFGLDWRVITVVPQKDFTAGVEATKQQSVLMGLSALGVSVILGILATRWLVRPILKLSRAAMQMGNSEFDPASLAPLTQRSDEIGQLAQVFQQSFAVVHDREQSLHTRVQELTEETTKLKHLETANRMGGTAHLRGLLARSQHLRLQVSQRTLQLPDLLRTLPFFSLANEAELSSLLALGQEQRLAPGEVICRENEPEDHFYILLAGQVAVSLEQFNLSLDTLTAGHFFGEIALLLETPRTATVKTVEPSILFVSDRRGFQTLYHQYPDLAVQIDQKVQERLDALKKLKRS